MWLKRISLLLLDDKHCDTIPFHCMITRGGGISDVLNSQYKKNIEAGENSEERKEGNREAITTIMVTKGSSYFPCNTLHM